jgi:hypothetical protein
MGFNNVTLWVKINLIFSKKFSEKIQMSYKATKEVFSFLPTHVVDIILDYVSKNLVATDMCYACVSHQQVVYKNIVHSIVMSKGNISSLPGLWKPIYDGKIKFAFLEPPRVVRTYSYKM